MTSRKDMAMARALAGAITSAKRSPDAPVREQRAGRIDRARVARLAQGDARIFTRPGAPAPRRLRVIIMLDGSGSMVGYRAEQTNQLARDFAEAVTLLPTVTAEVWVHTTHHGGYSPTVAHLWSKGEDTRYVDDYMKCAFSGNVDGAAIAWVAEDLAKALKHDEQGLIIMVSDGAPAYPGRGDAFVHMDLIRRQVKRDGIGLVSVSVAGALNAEVQRRMYGEGNFVEYDSNPNVLARGMAKCIGRALS